jgi:hypothetical protein
VLVLLGQSQEPKEGFFAGSLHGWQRKAVLDQSSQTGYTTRQSSGDQKGFPLIFVPKPLGGLEIVLGHRIAGGQQHMPYGEIFGGDIAK